MNSKMFQKNQNYFWIQKIEFENYLLDVFIDFESEKMGLMLDNFWLRRVKRTNDTSLERKWSGASNKKGFKWFWLLSTEKKLSEHDILNRV